jgi:colanic acid/amylovoran biosynthesis glycosyltransferase
VLATRLLNTDYYPLEKVFHPENPLSGRCPIIDRVFRRFGFYPPEVTACYRRILDRFPPAVIHAHFGWDGYFMLRLKRRAGAPLITRFYGYDIGILPRLPLWQRRFRRLFAEGDGFIVEGNFMKGTLESLGCPSHKIAVHHLGVELESIPYKQREYGGGPLRILIAATFKEKKGIEYALRAIALLANRQIGRKLQVTVVGDGELRDHLHGLALDLGIAADITWRGRQPHTVFIEELYLSHVFLSPSVTAADGDTEGGAPVALIEAQASGLPVISTLHADIPEIVRDGETGCLVPERDVAAIASAIEAFLKNPTRVARLGRRAREHAVAHFDAFTQGRQLTEIYNEVIRSR